MGENDCLQTVQELVEDEDCAPYYMQSSPSELFENNPPLLFTHSGGTLRSNSHCEFS